MGQYCFAGWRLSLSVVVICNAAGGQAGWSATGSMGTRRGNAAGGQASRALGVWTVSAPAAGRVDSRAADTARWASHVTSR